MAANLFLRSLYDDCSAVKGWGGDVRHILVQHLNATELASKAVVSTTAKRGMPEAWQSLSMPSGLRTP
jgi:hypothetical protein